MTILAQHWLERRRTSQIDFWVSTRLGVPIDLPGQDIPDLDTLAERFVFADDLAMLGADLNESGQLPTHIVYETVRMPCPCVWLEWKVEDFVKGMRVGVLLEKHPHAETVTWAVIASLKDSPAELLSTGRIDALPFPKGERPSISVAWTAMNGYQPQQDAACYVAEALVGMFLVQQPKIFEEELYSADAKLQRARAKRQKPPLIEYRKIHLKIGSVSKRSLDRPSGGGSGEAVGKRRYHRVLGHFRIYGRGTAAARPVWIEPHFRGDPALGVLIREREVSR